MEGIVLKSTPHGETGRVFTLFLSSTGLCPVLVRTISRKNSALQTASSPLTRGDYLVRQGRKELYYLQEAHVKEAYVRIRQDYDRLHTALSLCRYIYTSQMSHTPLPKLFALLKAYLNQLEKTDRPHDILAASFLIKLLKHDGYAVVTSQDTLAHWEPEEVHLIAHLNDITSFKQLPTDPQVNLLPKLESLMTAYTR